MDQERNEVREVDDARRRVAEDVRNVAENANVVERAKERAQSKIDDVRETMSERVTRAREKLEDARDQMQRLSPSESPIGMLIAGVAVGFLIGLALPVTRFESERIGPLAHDMKNKARQASSEAARRGTEVIKETISAGREAAGRSIREQTRDMGMGEMSD
jgi:methyl-accepting chemotaxis protein